MSDFSNPASRSKADAAAYTHAVLELLGPREPLDVLRSTVSLVGRAVEGLSADRMVQPEASSKWSIRHVIQHLADSEWVWGYRLRMVLAQDRPQLTGYDQDLWANRLQYSSVDVQHALKDFDLLRASNLRLLGRVPRETFARVGVHAERGDESVAQMMRLYAGHDLLHLAQIERIRRVITARHR